MNNLKPTLRYIWLTMKHKAFVFRAGLWTGAPIWNLIIHDWTKFTPAEAPHYGRQFFGSKDDEMGFQNAWNHHQKANPHHWEYWVPASEHNRWEGGTGGNEPLPMPEKYVREMVADWLGASRAYGGKWPRSLSEWVWFRQNYRKLRLHGLTQARVEETLKRVFGTNYDYRGTI